MLLYQHNFLNDGSSARAMLVNPFYTMVDIKTIIL